MCVLHLLLKFIIHLKCTQCGAIGNRASNTVDHMASEALVSVTHHILYVSLLPCWWDQDPPQTTLKNPITVPRFFFSQQRLPWQLCILFLALFWNSARDHSSSALCKTMCTIPGRGFPAEENFKKLIRGGKKLRLRRSVYLEAFISNWSEGCHELSTAARLFNITAHFGAFCCLASWWARQTVNDDQGVCVCVRGRERWE